MSESPELFYTIGYGGRPPEEFVGLLRLHGVRTVADVRSRPDRSSMGAYTKAKTAEKGIERLLSDAGVDYRWLPELGNLFLDLDDWSNAYTELIDRAGSLLTRRLIDLPRPFCLLCAEKRVESCHRKIVADDLVRRTGWVVEHIE